MADEGTLAIGEQFILLHRLEDDGSLTVHIVHTDPTKAQFWVTVPVSGEPSYTRYLPTSPQAAEVAQALVDSGDLDKGFVEQAQAQADAEAEAAKQQRIAELESELKGLKE